MFATTSVPAVRLWHMFDLRVLWIQGDNGELPDLTPFDVQVIQADNLNLGLGLLIDNDIDAVVMNESIGPTAMTTMVGALREDLGQRPVIIVHDTPSVALPKAIEFLVDDVVESSIHGAALANLLRRRIRGARAYEALRKKHVEVLAGQNVDSETHLPNRHGFFARLRTVYSEAMRHDDAFTFILFAPRADKPRPEFIARFSSILIHAVRGTDSVARVDENGFGVVLPRTRLHGALSVVERVESRLKTEFGKAQLLSVVTSERMISRDHLDELLERGFESLRGNEKEHGLVVHTGTGSLSPTAPNAN
jgi:GGDEF domain-containing protein